MGNTVAALTDYFLRGHSETLHIVAIRGDDAVVPVNHHERIGQDIDNLLAAGFGFVIAHAFPLQPYPVSNDRAVMLSRFRPPRKPFGEQSKNIVPRARAHLGDSVGLQDGFPNPKLTRIELRCVRRVIAIQQ